MNGKMKLSIKELILFGMLGGIVSLSQIALSFIPNVETVTLFIIIFSLIYREKTLFVVFVFVSVMGIVYGFGLWWWGYLVIWPLLCVLTVKLRRILLKSSLIMSVYSGLFGLLFGAFFAIPYAVFGGINAGIAYWVSGIPYDIIHGVGNYFIMLVLGEFLFKLINRLNKRYICSVELNKEIYKEKR